MVSTPTVLVRTEEAARMRVKHPPASFISAANSLLDLNAVHENLHGHILGYITSLLDTYFIKNFQWKVEICILNFGCAGANMGQTARATAGNSSIRGAQQRKPVRGAVVMATVGWDYINPARHRISSSGHPRIKNTSYRTPGRLSCCFFCRNNIIADI